MSYAPLNIDPDSKNPKGLDYPIYKQRHSDYYNVWECKNKYLSLLQTEKDKLENRAYNGKCNELEAEYKKACLSKESRIKKHEATLETLKHKYELAVEKEMIEYESAMQYWDGQEKCFDSKLKQEKKKQDFEILPVNVKKALREYEGALKGYCTSYKYRPKDMFIEIPADHIEYNIPPPITKEDIDSRNSLQDAYRIEAEREREEERKREIEREKARARRDMENALEEQKQTEKRKKELEGREQQIHTPPPSVISSNIEYEYTIDELLEFLKDDIDALYHSRKEEMKKKLEQSIKDHKKQLLKQGMSKQDIERLEKEYHDEIFNHLEEQKKDNAKPVDEATVIRNRQAYLESLKTPPPIAPKKPAIKKPKREENLHEDIHTYGIPCA
jgi:hypothetical protein